MIKKTPKNLSPKQREVLKVIEDAVKNLKKTGMESYLGNKGYSIYKDSLNHEMIDYIKNELTVQPQIHGSIVEAPYFPVYQESEKKLYVPRFWGITTFGPPKSIKLSKGDDIGLQFKGDMRDYQMRIVDAYMKAINAPDQGTSSALIELKCGGGKTVLALKIIEQVKKKTIIFVHKTFLKNQWIERIGQFLPGARIGSIQGQTLDIDDKDIVIAMVQSISMKAYPDSLFDSFGLSIYDEVHHLSSEVFSNCLKKCNTLCGLGLSATMERKDGLTHVFKMYLGEICFKSRDDEVKDDVLVKAIAYETTDSEYNEVERDYRGNVKYSTMISKISNFGFRSDFIVDVLKTELRINPEQQIILLAHNKSLLNYLFKAITFATVGYYIGGMKEAALKQSETKVVILATYAMAAEALDIKTLTTLLLASPKSDIVQAVGRILRQKHRQPVIIDIIDTVEPFLNQFNKRRAFYNEKGYKIIRTTNDQYIEFIKELNKNTNTDMDIQEIKDIEMKYYQEMKMRKSKKKHGLDSTTLELEAKCLIDIG